MDRRDPQKVNKEIPRESMRMDIADRRRAEEALKESQARFRSLLDDSRPVVVLSSSDDQKDHRESARLGANSFVRKPVSYEEFRNLIQELVSFWCQC